MDFKDSYPDYVEIEEHIRRARLERSLALAQMIADVTVGTIRGLKRLAGAVGALRNASPLPAVKGPATR